MDAAIPAAYISKHAVANVCKMPVAILLNMSFNVFISFNLSRHQF